MKIASLMSDIKIYSLRILNRNQKQKECSNGRHSIVKHIKTCFLKQQNMDLVTDSTIIRFINRKLN